MSTLNFKSWFLTALLIGAGYASVGILFALPTEHTRAWRLAAWLVSGVAYVLHLAFESFRRRNAPLLAALHVSFAVALGAFGLAIGANIHSLTVAGGREHQKLLLIALAAWPLLTAVPAFLIGLFVSGFLSRLRAEPKQ